MIFLSAKNHDLKSNTQANRTKTIKIDFYLPCLGPEVHICKFIYDFNNPLQNKTYFVGLLHHYKICLSINKNHMMNTI